MQLLHVILDPGFGERLRQIRRGPIWVVMSPINEPVVRSLWATDPKSNHLDGITSFNFHEEITAEDRFLDELDTIDLHHGPYSTEFPYTFLNVIGVQLTENIRHTLSEIGFSDFSENCEGFIANRSEDEAKKLRR